MALHTLSNRRRAALISALSAVILCGLFLYYHPEGIHFSRHDLPPPTTPITTITSTPEPPPTSEESQELSPPADYLQDSSTSRFCADNFGIPYLEVLRDSATEYCTADSKSSLVCFHTTVTHDRRTDTFCLGQNAVFDPASQKFNLHCELAEVKKSNPSATVPEFGNFAKYWYDTGPQPVLDRWVQLNASDGETLPSPVPNYTILIKREGSENLWHCLLEMFSMAMTVDVLQMTWRPDHSRPFLSGPDADNTQVVILDERSDGPYFHLWSLFANKPTLRLKELPNNETLGNIIVPLAGGSNPFWQGDWEVIPCRESSLLRTFTHRVLDIYDLGNQEMQPKDHIVVTFINRVESRRLVDQDFYLDSLRSTSPLVKVQSIDFASIPLQAQLTTIQNTDILVGVHGAGLTHTMFLPPRSVVVEFLPPTLKHKGFRNLAYLQGHSYLSAHGTELPEVKRGNWHGEDVFIEKERFMDVMNTAIKLMYNSGPRNYDAV